MIFHVSLLISVRVRGNIVNALPESPVLVFTLFADRHFVVAGLPTDSNENLGTNGDW